MTRRRGLLMVVIVAAAVGAVVATWQVRQRQAAVSEAAQDIEDELEGLDPVAKAQVAAKVGRDVAAELRAEVEQQAS